MGTEKATAYRNISKLGRIAKRSSCGYITGLRQQGSILVLGIGTLVITIMLLGFVVNYNYWNYKKSTIADIAEVVAQAGIRNQLYYRAVGDPPTNEMVDEMAAEQDWGERLNGVTIAYEFGLTEGGIYVSIPDEDPNPAIQPFNTIRVQVCTALDDISGNFTLAENDTCVWTEAKFVLDECYCEYAVCPVSQYSGLGRSLCLLGCVVSSTVSAALNLVFTLNLEDLFLALDCGLDNLVLSVNTAVEWVLGDDAVHLTYTRHT